MISQKITYLALVPHLSLSPASVSDVFVLSADLSDDGVHVEIPAVVHLHNN